MRQLSFFIRPGFAPDQGHQFSTRSTGSSSEPIPLHTFSAQIVNGKSTQPVGANGDGPTCISVRAATCAVVISGPSLKIISMPKNPPPSNIVPKTISKRSFVKQDFYHLIFINHFAEIVFLKVPIPSMVISISSPRSSGPTPAGVPVKSKSPGSRVMTEEAKAMT